MLNAPPNLEGAIKRASDFSEWIVREAQIRGLTTVEIAIALQGTEVIERDKSREAWTIAWDLASRVWARAAYLHGRKP